MKNIIKIFAAAGIGLLFASCGSAGDLYGNNSSNYPNGGPVYRTGDGSIYRPGEVYRDRQGNVYQNGRIIQSGDVYNRPGVIYRNSNQNTVYYPSSNARNLPPGQAKKMYGGNARDYAPGQVKKRNKYDNDRSFRNDRENRKDDGRRFENRNDTDKKVVKNKNGRRVDK